MFSLPHINQSHFLVGASADSRGSYGQVVLCVCLRDWSLPVINTKWEGDGVGDGSLPLNQTACPAANPEAHAHWKL